MANVLVDESALSDIADAIRSKLSSSDTYKPSEMATAIGTISGGGITPTGTKQISISSNGTTTEDVTSYASAEITVSVGGGSSGLTLIDTLTLNASRSAQINVDSSWFGTYDYVLVVPDITLSASDYVYFAVDATTSSKYTPSMSTYKNPYFIMFSKGSGANIKVTAMLNASATQNVTSYVYLYTYSSSKTMTGTLKVYGIKL